MSLQVTYDRRSQLCKAGFGFTVGYVPSNDEGHPHTVRIHDLFLGHLVSGVFFCPAKPRSPSRVLGFNVEMGDTTEHQLVSFKPVSYKYNSGSYDDSVYGSFFRNLQLFGSTLSGVSLISPSRGNEHNGRHVSYRGELIAEAADVPFTVVNYDFWGNSYPVRSTNGVVYEGATVRSVTPLLVDVVGTGNYGSNVNINIIDLLQQLLGNRYTNIALIEGKVIERVLSDVSYDVSDSGLVIQYHMLSRLLDGSEYTEWNSTATVPFREPPQVISPVVGQTQHAWLGYPCSFSYTITDTVTSSSDPGPRHEEYVEVNGNWLSFCIFLSYPVDPSDAMEVSGGALLSKLSQRYFLRKFEVDVWASWADIVPSNLHSSVASFKEAEGYLGVNVLQNLIKIPDILDNITFLVDAVKVLGRLVKRDLSLASIRDVINLGTSATLRANFEWRPYLDLFTRYLPQMLATLQSLGLKSNVVGRGSFSFKISNDLGRKEVTLVTRTKIVMDASPSGLLSATLGIDALGLLPKASNLWDLIPFTFVVNWFTGVGEAMRRAEYAALMATIPAVFTHTYTLTSPLTEDELAVLKASSAGTESCSLRVYIRDVTQYNPAFRDSRFAFGIPQHLPSVGVIGSLLYQLIFAGS